MIESAIPLKGGYSIDIYGTSLTEIGGLKVAQFAAVVDMGSSLSRDTSMVGLHRNRIVKISLNYFDGSMSPEVGEAINALYSSLKFY